MRKTFDHKQRADACARWARIAVNDRARDVWLTLEQYWRQRANAVDAPLVSEPPVNKQREPLG